MHSCAVVGVGLQVAVGSWVLAVSLGACGPDVTGHPLVPDTTVPAPVSIGSAAGVGSASPPSEVATAARAPAEAKAQEGQPGAEDEPARAPTQDPDAVREIKYFPTPEGLKIELSGVRFVVSAEAKQVAQGWGAKVRVKAESLDGKDHLLLSGRRGPIAFAPAVFKTGSTEAERIPDSRGGDASLKIGAGSGAHFSREFPDQGGRALGLGETLDLEVGLWGLGDTLAERRPVKQFFHVKMKVGRGKPQVLVEPPTSAAK